ncbi:hypothetical protein [Hymenobacter lapidiphilus]|uniref:Energy transducer TonB n=1 Tax=Hymenobacter lapidiphilus TaxID=2608003 RepID=A0A7Y7PTJ4_9BACT|nr:hypothetical protein [Hymenobacter lapidiphilus]NVO33547.1 hypothetical protein [Hymenobacter lapidiphilus]
MPHYLTPQRPAYTPRQRENRATQFAGFLVATVALLLLAAWFHALLPRPGVDSAHRAERMGPDVATTANRLPHE